MAHEDASAGPTAEDLEMMEAEEEDEANGRPLISGNGLDIAHVPEHSLTFAQAVKLYPTAISVFLRYQQGPRSSNLRFSIIRQTENLPLVQSEGPPRQ